MERRRSLVGERLRPRNYYKKVVNVDPQPVKLLNDPGKQQTFENLPVGVTIEFTVTSVNDAGKGQASEPASEVVA